MFWGSSRQHGIAPDGTHEVRCYQCRDIISRTTQPISRALCLLCEKAEQGIPLTTEAILAYKAARDAAGGVPLLVIDETPRVEGDSKFTMSAIGDNLSRAIGFLRRKPEAAKESTVIARGKRRGKLLDGLVTHDVGAMEEIDAMLRNKQG